MLSNLTKMMYFDAPADNGAGTDTQPAGEHTPENSGKKPVTFESEEAYQADIEAKLKERLERERRKGEEAAAKAKREAEEAAALKNGEWQKLAEQRAADLEKANADLKQAEAVQAKADRYEAALKKQLEAQRAAMPKHILALLDKLDPAEQLEYIATNADALKVTPPKGPGSPPPPKGRSNNQPAPQGTDKPLIRL